MIDTWIAIIGLITGCGMVGFLTFVITARQIRREAELKNDGMSVEILKSVVTELKEESAGRKEEREQYREDLLNERSKNEDLREENTSSKMLMCIHLGCSLRAPLLGQGDSWYQAHKSDPSLGADYLPINQLLKKYGDKKKEKQIDSSENE